MKRVVKFFGVAAAGLLVMTTVSAQRPISGPVFGKVKDSLACIIHLSLYQQDFQHRNYDAAIVNWRKVWRDCPESSVNNGRRGIIMYQNLINRELDQNKRKALVDTLMQVYEKELLLRPHDRGNTMANMVQDVYRFGVADLMDQADLLKLLEEAMILQKENTLASVYANYMKIIMAQNVAGKMSDENLLDDYTKVSDFISAAIRATPKEELARVRDMIDDSFAASSAASCENLLKIYGAKYEANRNDADFLRKLTRMLTRKECTDSELFEKASVQQYELNPNPDAAYNMAMLFFRKENFDEAVKYFEHAINSENDPIDKARYNYLLGRIMLANYNKHTDAKKYLNEAIRLRPDWGDPYIQLAITYANGSKCGESDFEQRQVYWVVVDKLQRARTVDPDVASRVNPMISQYSQHFPKKEDGFFLGITEGNAITVGCWINERTTVRFIN